MKDLPQFQKLAWDAKLENESDEDYNDRDIKREGESDEDFEKRYNNRNLLVEQRIADSINKFASLGIDLPTYRLLNVSLAKRRSDLINNVIGGFAIRNGRTNSVNVELTDYIRELLSSGKSIDEVKQLIKKHVRESERKKIDKVF
jgi:hypothetical protein